MEDTPGHMAFHPGFVLEFDPPPVWSGRVGTGRLPWQWVFIFPMASLKINGTIFWLSHMKALRPQSRYPPIALSDG